MTVLKEIEDAIASTSTTTLNETSPADPIGVITGKAVLVLVLQYTLRTVARMTATGIIISNLVPSYY